jgi:hypothetical protein
MNDHRYNSTAFKAGLRDATLGNLLTQLETCNRLQVIDLRAFEDDEDGTVQDIYFDKRYHIKSEILDRFTAL